MPVPDHLETIRYEETDGVAWVTLDRPDVHNAFNERMQQELRELWTALRRHDAVRCVVLTGAGEKAFCTGIDRTETLGDDGEASSDDDDDENGLIGFGSTPFMFDDPGHFLGPKTNDLWKPVIAAVNGMACGGAFYMLGEVDFIIAADHATFFDPHVTYGMPAAFEPIQILSKAPLQEVLRMTLLGNHERMSAARAREIGLVSEVVPAGELREAAGRCAAAIASAPALAVQASLRAIWAAHELGRKQALDLAYGYVAMGLSPESLAEGQAAFTSGKRIDWRLR